MNRGCGRLPSSITKIEPRRTATPRPATQLWRTRALPSLPRCRPTPTDGLLARGFCRDVETLGEPAHAQTQRENSRWGFQCPNHFPPPPAAPKGPLLQSPANPGLLTRGLALNIW